VAEERPGWVEADEEEGMPAAATAATVERKEVVRGLAGLPLSRQMQQTARQ